ncbi:MAG TPA: PEP-CTERM sorting domain-containing protein [Bryobacteraceae bacterium]|nr:PEP-CTERM sorting domain-containing protein [Bryobacteraceae bacterium]
MRQNILFGLCLSAVLARATILPPAGSPPVAPSDFTTPVTGPFLADTGVQAYTTTNSLGQSTITGDYRAMVYADASNVFCTGCLDFFVLVTSNASSLDDIERITLASFSSYETDVGYSTGSGSVLGTAPETVDRSTGGAVIGFNFAVPTGVAPGSETEVLEIETNATSFVAGTLQIIDSSVASVAAFAPAVVPEASSISMTLLGAALLGAGLIGRRRRAKRNETQTYVSNLTGPGAS